MIDIALIGTGYWGKKLQPYLEEQFNLKYTFNSKSELKWDVDAVVIATPNETHFPLAKMALLKGKHVLVEKPPAPSFNECVELGEVAGDRVLMTDYPYTFANLPNGDVKSITVNRTDRFVGRDVYQVLGSHALSILSMFVPLNSLQFQIQDGGLAFGNKDMCGRIYLDLNAERKTEVICEQGTYNLDEPHTLRHVVNHFAKAIKGEAQDNFPLALSISRILNDLS